MLKGFSEINELILKQLNFSKLNETLAMNLSQEIDEIDENEVNAITGKDEFFFPHYLIALVLQIYLLKFIIRLKIKNF